MTFRTTPKRGQAMVEMSVSFIIFIPILLYVIFLQDMLRYRLEQQEAVVSAPWDFSNQDFNATSSTNFGGSHERHAQSIGDIEHWNRMMWCDHHSGMDSFNDSGANSPDCSDINHSADPGAFSHHSGLAAHGCWLNPDSEQLSCDPVDTTVGAAYNDPLTRSFHASQFNKGGMFRCRANLVVQNYMLPTVFLNFNKNASGTDKALILGHQTATSSQDIHNNAQRGNVIVKDESLDDAVRNQRDTYIFAKENFAVVVDSWALNPAVVREPGDKAKGPLWDQVNYLYGNNGAYPFYAAAATTFLANAVSQDVLSPLALPLKLNPFDDPLLPNLSIHKVTPTVNIPQEGGNRQYSNVPWQAPYQNAYNARGANYMGCKNAQSC